MPELTPEPDSTGGENKKKKIFTAFNNVLIIYYRKI
jgi:hypothetical protein